MEHTMSMYANKDHMIMVITEENKNMREQIQALEIQLVKEAARTADYKQRYEQINKQHTMLVKRYSEACND